jgi:hypothetical protein
MATPCCKDVKISAEHTWPDYDWNKGDRPVTLEDSLVAMPIALDWRIEHQIHVGLILREVTDGLFERMGLVSVECDVLLGKDMHEQIQILRDFVETLPIRQVKII